MARLSLAVMMTMVMASGAAAQPAIERLSVDEAVALALAHNRSLASAALQTEKADLDVATARSQRLPQFSVEAQASQLLRPIDLWFAQGSFGTYPGIGPVPAVDTAVTTPMRPSFVLNAQVAQPLTQLPRINLGVRMSEASRELEREALRSARVTLVGEVKRVYYAILQSESALVAAAHSITQLRELERMVGDRVAQQVALTTDALDVRARLAQAEHSRLTIRNGVASQKEQLNLLLGRDVRTAFETSGVPAITLPETDLTAAQTRALDDRPDIRQARLRVRQAEIARQLARAESMPDLSLAVTYIAPMNIEGAPRHIATAGLQLQWEPFDWGRRSRTVATKDVEIKQAASALRDAEDRAVLDINAQFRRLEEARSRLRVASFAQDTAREASRMRATQYRVRAALLADVLQSDAAEADANNQYQQALAAFWIARADFERALGQDVMR